MKRKMTAYLLNWKNNRKNALIVYGARQVGKSYSIDEFARNNFKNYLLIDFSKNMDALSLLESFKDKEDFYNKISFFNIHDEDCVIFFDEIQELYNYRKKRMERNPEIYLKTIDLITLIKDLVQDAKYRYVISGSMLGVTLSGVNLNPTGYMDMCVMYPMDYEEFLWARGIGENVVKLLLQHFTDKTPVEEAIHDKMIDLFNEYVLVGGMPAAVSEYVKSKEFQNVEIVQDGIYNFYNADILKYADTSDRLIISEMFNMLSAEVNNINKRFIKNHLDIKNIKNLDLIDKYSWLTNSGIALPVYNVTSLNYPLKLSEERKVLKLFHSDVGLLSNRLMGSEGRLKFLRGEIKVNFGANYENAVAQELVAHGFKELNYYNSKKSGEIDFVLERNTEVELIEVKSGKTNEMERFNHKSLDNALEKYDKINKAYVFSKENVSVEGRIINYPIYMIMFLKR